MYFIKEKSCKGQTTFIFSTCSVYAFDVFIHFLVWTLYNFFFLKLMHANVFLFNCCRCKYKLKYAFFLHLVIELIKIHHGSKVPPKRLEHSLILVHIKAGKIEEASKLLPEVVC